MLQPKRRERSAERRAVPFLLVDFADQHKLSCAPQTHIYDLLLISIFWGLRSSIKFSVCSLLVSSTERKSNLVSTDHKKRALYLASQFGPARGMPEKKTIQNLHTHTRTTLFKIFILTPVFTVPVCFASAVGVSVRQVDQVKGLKGGCRCRVEAGAGGPDTGAASARVSTPTVRAHEWHPPNARAPRA